MSTIDVSIAKQAGAILGTILRSAEEFARSNIDNLTKIQLNDFIAQEIGKAGAEPLFLGHDAGFGPYPKETVICLNEEIVHAIPDATPIRAHDLLTIDVGVRYNGICMDAARTITFGNFTDHKRLINATKEAFDRSVEIIKDGIDIYEIGRVIERTAHKYDVSIVRELTGHGIGTELWEEPHIYQFPAEHVKLHAGKCYAIEPIFAIGNGKMKTKKDTWTISTRDGSLSAQYENTILVTKDGCEVLTKV